MDGVAFAPFSKRKTDKTNFVGQEKVQHDLIHLEAVMFIFYEHKKSLGICFVTTYPFLFFLILILT